MTHRFLHLGVAYASVWYPERIDPIVMAVSDDWIRYSNSTWILWTDRSPSTCAEVLRPKLNPTDQFLIVPIDHVWANGWLSPWIWQWLAAPRNVETGKPLTVSPLANLLPPPS